MCKLNIIVYLRTRKFSTLMEYTIFLVTALLLMVAIFYIYRYNSKGKPAVEDHHDHAESNGGCCGKHLNCEKGNNGEELYFDDEELDRFKGKSSGEYVDDEVEEFRQVLYTMKEDEVDAWVHCLQLRGIELPADVKEEVLMILRK